MFFKLLEATILIFNINKARYTATEVACGWAGAIMKKAFGQVSDAKTVRNAEKAYTDRPTD